MRTYAGHSSAAESNALYRRNLEKGQTGLSVAFDLPTQTGYDPDDELAKGEVGRVGVPISHVGDARKLFDGIPLENMNTSMTINATAMWLLALYQVVAEEQGADVAQLTGTTQNDIIKEYLSRGTYVFPPGPSLRLITDMVAYTVTAVPKWNPINVCSYHLQEAGATPVQEIAYALCTAIAVLDAVRDSGQVPPERFGDVVGRISFFVNAGVRFVEEMCKMRAFARLWDDITRERYGVTNDKQRRLRYGVQVNSLGLTEQQPENNVQRIVLEMLGVTLSRDARARAVQLPAWNEALGLPRPWDQQWSLRLQQVLAYETDLLEYDDLFAGSHVVEAKVAEIEAGARAEIDRVQAMGGAVAAVESGYMKGQLVRSLATHRGRIESGEEIVVGVNKFAGTEPNPLTADVDRAILTLDPDVEQAARRSITSWRASRDTQAVTESLTALRDAAKTTANLMEPTLACARGRHHGGVGGRAARGVRRVPGADGHRRRPGERGRRGNADGRPQAGARHGRGTGRAAAHARRQAGPGRAQQRGGADRRPGAGRGVRGRVPGHPADSRADRRGGGGGGRRRGRTVHSLRFPPRGRSRGARRAAGGRARRHAGGRRRHHPGRRRRRAAQAGRGAGVHPEGFRDDGHHGRDRDRDPGGRWSGRGVNSRACCRGEGRRF
jgi:(2R)-ethylmalonyl-CoA mutase